jgi:hypothetical protein
MSTPSTPRPEHLDIDHDRVLDDELEVEPTEEGLPDQLDLPIDVPEADAIEQQLEVPPNGDERR